MIDASPLFSPIPMAASLLYLVLGLATLGVKVGTRARPASQLRSQVFSWWLIFPVVSASLLIYPLGPFLLVLLIAGLAVRELAAHLPADTRPGFMAACVAATVAALLAACSVPAGAALVAALALLALRLQGTRASLLLAAFASAIAGVSFIVALMRHPLAGRDASWLFYLFVLTALNDIGQFISGTLFGRQKVVPTLSPNKTWQGLGGGVLISVLLSVGLGRFLALAPAAWLAATGAALALAGFVGDIAFSSVKRRLHIKDFSALIPGHGGILDRVDSLVLTAPLLYLVIDFTLQGSL